MHSCVQGAEAYARGLYMEELTDFFCLFLNYFILAGGSVCSVSLLLKLDY